MGSPRSPTDTPDLQARIHEAERALIRRDLRVHAAVAVLRERTEQLTSATHWLSSVGTIGSLVLGLLSRRRRREPEHHGAAAGAGLLQFLPLLWPLLPLPLRRRFKPAEVALVVRLAWPWLSRLCRPRAESRATHTQRQPRSAGR